MFSFDRLTTNGIFGLLSYLGLLGVALYICGQKEEKQVCPLKIRLCSGVCFWPHFFNNLFVFDNLISLILFATFLAYVSFHSKPTLTRQSKMQ